MGEECVVARGRRGGTWAVAGVGLLLLVTPVAWADGEKRRITFTNGRTVDAEVVEEDERELVIRVGQGTVRIKRSLVRSVGAVQPAPRPAEVETLSGPEAARAAAPPAAPGPVAPKPRKGAELAAAIEGEADGATRARLEEAVVELSPAERQAFVGWARTTRERTGAWERLAPALGRLDDEGAARELGVVLRLERERRGDVVAALTSCSARVGVPALLEGMGLASVQLRATVTQAVAELAAREPRDAFFALRRATNARAEGQEVLDALVAQAVEAACERVADPGQLVREAAAQLDCDPLALGLARGLAARRVGVDVNDVLVGLVGSGRSETRVAAVRAAALNGKLESWGRRLVTLLRDDGNPEVRQAAWQALRTMSGQDRPFSWKHWSDLLEAREGP